MSRKMLDVLAIGKEIFIGLEDSKRTWRLCVKIDGYVFAETSLETNYSNLQAYLKRYVDCKIRLVYEAGFKGFNLYDKLTEDGVDCVVLPPHLLAEAKGAKVKTDKRDAKSLARMAEQKDCPACHVPDKERREDRQICRTLNAMEKEIKSTRNRLRKLLQMHGIEVASDSKSVWQKSDFFALRSLNLSPSLTTSVNALLKILEELWTLQTNLRKDMKKLAEKERYKKAFDLLKSFPGIGELTAIRLILELGEDLERFKSGEAIAAFVGLTCCESSTGETTHRGRITGNGPRFVRSWLVENSWTAVRHDPALMDFFNRVAKNSGSRKKAIVAVARKLVVRMRACVMSGKPYVIGVVQ